MKSISARGKGQAARDLVVLVLGAFDMHRAPACKHRVHENRQELRAGSSV